MSLKIWSGSAWTEATGVKVWNGSSWVTASAGKIWNGSTWVDFLAPVTFTPDGGTSGSPTTYSDSSDIGSVSYTITASSAVTWYYTKSGSGATSVANGASASSITMTQNLGATSRTGTWNVYASNGIENKYWTVTLETIGTGVVMTL